jgi:hypothetical protein
VSSLRSGKLLALLFSCGDENISFKLAGGVAPVRAFEDDRGEMQMMLEMLFRLDADSSRAAGVSPLVKLATSEKKNDVLTVGVRGVRGPPGVFSNVPYPPGEKRPFAVGDCNHANTFDVSNEPFDIGFCLP